MAEQAWWENTAKWLGGLAALATAIRSYFKARNTNHADRILRLERESREDRRVMSEVRSEIEELDIRLKSTETRTRRLEVSHADTERMLRDELGRIGEGAQRVMEMLDRRLHASRSEQPEPRPER